MSEPVEITAQANPPPGSDYRDWKRWSADDFARLGRGEEMYFRSELKRCGVSLQARLRVLEIGFGNGQFLAFARKQGWAVQGTELSDAAVAVARARGFDALRGERLSGFPSAEFDLVAAFDVLEHIETASLLPFLRDVKRVLRPGGIFLARFPNGDSPFGLVNQNGDPTHVTAIGSEKARALVSMLGVELIRVGAEALPILAPTPAHTVHRLVSRPFKLALETTVRLLFYPRGNVSFTAENLVMAFRKGSE